MGKAEARAWRHGDGLVQEEDAKQGSASRVRDEQAERMRIVSKGSNVAGGLFSD